MGTAVERYLTERQEQEPPSAVARYLAARQQQPEQPPTHGVLSDVGRGAATGLAKAGTSLIKGVGYLTSKIPGLDDAGDAITRFGNEQEQQAEAFYDPRGTAGTVGEIGGRILGEGATTLAGGGLVGKAIEGLAPASKAAQALAVGREGTLAQRVAANTLPFVPVDATLGAGSAAPGESRATAAATNVALGIGGAAAIEGVGDAIKYGKKLRRAKRLADLRVSAVPEPPLVVPPKQLGPGAASADYPRPMPGESPLGPAIPTREPLPPLRDANGAIPQPPITPRTPLPAPASRIALPRHVPDEAIDEAMNAAFRADPERAVVMEPDEVAALRETTAQQLRRTPLRPRTGAASPSVLTPVATTGAGAAIGAATDQENRGRGALIGAGIGLGVGTLGVRAARAAGRAAVQPAYMTDPAVQTVANSIARSDKHIRMPLDVGAVARRAYTALVDELYPLRRFGQVVGGSDRLSQEAARATGWKGSAESRLWTDLRPVALQTKGHEDGVVTLAKAQRALELLDAGLEKTNIPRATLEATVAKLSQIPEVRDGANALRGYYRSLLDAKLANGVIDQPTYDAITATGQYYVPFVRDFQAAAKAPSAGGGKLFNRGTGVRKMTEGMASAQTVDPFQQAVLDTFEAERTIAKQRVANTVAGIVEAQPEAAAPFLRKVADRSAVKSGHVVEANIGGRRQAYEVLDPALYDAWASFAPATQSIFQRILAVPKRALRTGVTALPDFAVANAIRDNAQAAIQYQAPVRSMLGSAGAGAAVGALTDDEDRLRGALVGAGLGLGVGSLAPTAIRSARALATVLGKGDDYIQWLKEGGGGFSDFYARPAEARKLMRRMMDEHPSWLKSVITPRSTFGAIAELGKAIEEAPRVAKFTAMQAAGASIPESINASRDISLDFAKTGKDTKGIAAITAFWNAQVQGWDKLARLLRNPKTAGMAAATLTAPSIALWAINQDNPDYWATPQWERNLFWLVPKSHAEGESPFYRIPKPFELGFLFASLPERFLDYTHEHDPETTAYALKDMLSTTTEGIVPLPTAITPLVENASNYSFFRNRPIVSRGLERLPDDMQYDNRTSSAAVGLGHVTGYSPQKIDNVLRGYTGSAGGLALDLTSRAARATGLDRRPAQPDGKPPVVGRFLSRPDQTSDAEETIRRRYQVAATAIAGAKELDERGDRAALDSYIRDNAALLASYDELHTQITELNKIAQARRELGNDPTMTPDQKRKALTYLAAQANQIATGMTGRDQAVASTQ